MTNDQAESILKKVRDYAAASVVAEQAISIWAPAQATANRLNREALAIYQRIEREVRQHVFREPSNV